MTDTALIEWRQRAQKAEAKADPAEKLLEQAEKARRCERARD